MVSKPRGGVGICWSLLGKVGLCTHGQVIFISLDAHKDICVNPSRFSFGSNSASELSQGLQEGGPGGLMPDEAEFTADFLFV